jgi:hypothetical protein
MKHRGRPAHAGSVSEVPAMSASVISSITFIWLVLMATVTWSGFGFSSASI